MQVNIRPAVNKDDSILIDFALKLSHFNRHHHPDTSKYDDYEAVIEAIRMKAKDTLANRDENTLILVAETFDQPIGYVSARIFDEAATSDNGTGKMGLIDEIYVEDSARGLGTGKRLIEEVVQWMQSKGIRRIKLHAYSWNHDACRLYEKNGFQEYARSYEIFL